MPHGEQLGGGYLLPLFGNIVMLALCSMWMVWNLSFELDLDRRRNNLDVYKRQVRELGPETYVRELEEKRAILELLVGEWNDGRKKSFYTTAVYLLELDDLRHAVQQVTSLSTKEMSEKERAACMTQALQKIAEQQGLVLKLNKKQKRRSRGTVSYTHLPRVSCTL